MVLHLPEAPPAHGLGNPYCWNPEVGVTFQTCCGQERLELCFDGGAFSFEACCQTTPTAWLTEGAQTTAFMNVMIGSSSRSARPSFTKPASIIGIAGQRSLESLQSLTGQWNEDACRRQNGTAFSVSVVWADWKVHQTNFRFCAPRFCLDEEVASSLVPSLVFRSTRRHHAIPGPAVMQKVIVRRHAEVDPRLLRTGGVGPNNPPIDASALREYLDTYRICGRCPLKRYGSRNDGGYLMCEIAAEHAYVAAYSYGIEESDAWGVQIAKLTGAELLQYDCTLDKLPKPCSPSCRSRFFRECLSWRRGNYTGSDFGRTSQRRHFRFETLASHVLANGHGDLKEGSLLLKADIEGYERIAFWQAEISVLRKFRQIILEIHMPMLHLMDVESWKTRIGMMQNLLRVFTLVHVHANNGCSPGQCIEVLFVHKSFVLDAPCEWPRLHPLDEPNCRGKTELDIAALFHVWSMGSF